jgi:putative aldouronate transport system permease protein
MAEVNLSSKKKISMTKAIADWFIVVKKDFFKNKYVYLLALPVVLYYIIFHYIPMYGVQIAFKEFVPIKGIMGSKWIGLENFQRIAKDVMFFRALKNTVILSVYNILWSFPAPIILALLLNEVRSKLVKNAVQTITYLPHFVSIVVISGLIIDFTATRGLISDLLAMFGVRRTNLLTNPNLFRTIYISTGIWQEIGFNSIIYLSALSSIDTQLYEAASIDGAGRLSKLVNVTLPSITPTIIILLILKVGHIMGVGVDKIFLLYNPATYETADVISTYVYRKGLVNQSYSYSSAVGLFNSVINFALLISTNKISKKVSETSLW